MQRALRIARLAATAALVVAAVGAIAATGYFRTFGQVASSDEGYLMLSVRHLLDGQALYTNIKPPYGPLYYLEKWLLHGPLGVPLTSTAVRLTHIATLVTTASLGALLVFRMTGSVAMAIFALLLLQVPLGRLAVEPGHPQELATLLVVALPLAAAAASTRRALVLGLLVGGLLMTKVNVGLFSAVAVGLALVAVSDGASGRILEVVGALIAAAVPWALVWGADTPGAYGFAALVSGWVLALAMATVAGRPRPTARSEVVTFAVAAAAAGGVLAAFAWTKGATASAAWDALIVRPRALAENIAFETRVFPGAWPTMTASVLGALAWRARHQIGWVPAAAASAQILVGAAICHRTVHPAMVDLRYPVLLDVAPAAAWLLLVRDGGPAPLARLVLAWLTVLQPLQAYPLAGSQVACGLIPAIIAALILLSDGIAGVARALPPRLARPAVALAGLAVLAAAIQIGTFTLLVYRFTYEAGTPLALPGAEDVRAPANEAAVYRELVDAVKQRCTLLLTVPGFQSLNFWSGVRPPTLDLITHTTRLLPDDRIAALALTARMTPGLCVVRSPTAYWLPDPRFESQVMAQLKVERIIGTYLLLTRDTGRPRPHPIGSSPVTGGDAVNPAR